MRVPLSWLREYAPVGASVSGDEAAQRLTAAGLEVETVTPVGHDVRGVVVAQVTRIEELTGFRKPVRYCEVSTGAGESRWVICGAANFATGDKVPLAVPGAVLPGGLEIGAKQAYGRRSDGMICSGAELGIGDDHTGILVLEPEAPLGADFAGWSGLADQVLDIAVTPDRGYALSVRGVARELATTFGVPFTDPADARLAGDVSQVAGEVYPASIADPSACDRFVLREVRGLDPAARTPLWMRVRLARAGMRSVSVAVDVTNYLMIELGQPLHAFDRDRLSGPIVVRRARPGERLETLDHVVRDLDPDDILIADSSGPISMAGTMGGLATEISESTRNLVIEAAHFSAAGTARMSRRHRLFSEASYRFERGVDRELPLPASARAVALLAELGGATVVPGCTHAQAKVAPVTVTMPADYPDRVAGRAYGRATVIRRLREVGCQVSGDGEAGEAPGTLTVRPPSWRPDLAARNDLAEEVIRLEGYDNIPVRMPRAPAGRGLTAAQRLRRSIGRALAGAGYVEVLSQPFTSAGDWDRLHLPSDDPRRQAVRAANPLTEEEPFLRTTLLPGLLRVLARNAGRGFGDLALYELGRVFCPKPGGPRAAPILPVDRGPTAAEIASLDAALPEQPLRAGIVLAGNRELAGWWGPGVPAGWQDATEAAREVLRAAGVPFRVTAARYPPWHPGRCAAVLVIDAGGQERLAGHAGELHPAVVEAFRLPARACAVELDLSAVEAVALALGPVQAPRLAAFPVATQDVALIVARSVPAAEVEAALVAGAAASTGAQAAGAGGGAGMAGEAGVSLLEEARLFDVYTGPPVPDGHKSLAYRLRFRALDRTLTDEETAAVRDAAVAEAARRVGAVLRRE
jgi:phenylalanyl-tRNA synthetase beta chain